MLKMILLFLSDECMARACLYSGQDERKRQWGWYKKKGSGWPTSKLLQNAVFTSLQRCWFNSITVCIHFTDKTLALWAELLTQLMASQLRLSNEGLLLPHQKKLIDVEAEKEIKPFPPLIDEQVRPTVDLLTKSFQLIALRVFTYPALGMLIIFNWPACQLSLLSF